MFNGVHEFQLLDLSNRDEVQSHRRGLGFNPRKPASMVMYFITYLCLLDSGLHLRIHWEIGKETPSANSQHEFQEHSGFCL